MSCPIPTHTVFDTYNRTNIIWMSPNEVTVTGFSVPFAAHIFVVVYIRTD